MPRAWGSLGRTASNAACATSGGRSSTRLTYVVHDPTSPATVTTSPRRSCVGGETAGPRHRLGPFRRRVGGSIRPHRVTLGGAFLPRAAAPGNLRFANPSPISNGGARGGG